MLSASEILAKVTERIGRSEREIQQQHMLLQRWRDQGLADVAGEASLIVLEDALESLRQHQAALMRQGTKPL